MANDNLQESRSRENFCTKSKAKANCKFKNSVYNFLKTSQRAEIILLSSFYLRKNRPREPALRNISFPPTDIEVVPSGNRAPWYVSRRICPWTYSVEESFTAAQHDNAFLFQSWHFVPNLDVCISLLKIPGTPSLKGILYVIGYHVMNYRMPVSRYWMLVTGYWLHDTRSGILVTYATAYGVMNCGEKEIFTCWLQETSNRYV